MTKQIKDIQFEELNFFHTPSICSPSFIKATLDFLKSKNSKNLKKLSVKSCILQRKYIRYQRVICNKLKLAVARNVSMKGLRATLKYIKFENWDISWEN